jgi:hypothetical protein
MYTVTYTFYMAGQYEDGAVDRLRLAASGRIFSCAILKSHHPSLFKSAQLLGSLLSVFCGMFGLSCTSSGRKSAVKGTTNLWAA